MAAIPGSNPYASSATGAPGATRRATAADTSTTAAATKSLADNFDNFLTLLTTQLKNQDPLKPMESTEFTTQLVQFTGVEQQINANKSLDRILAQGLSNQTLQAASFIDRSVEARGNGVTLGADGDPVDFVYDLAAQATTASASITDAAGNVIKSFSVPVASGRNVATWDGKNVNGLPSTPGYYKFSVSARDAQGNAIQSTLKQIGVVQDISIENNGVFLNMNGQKVTIGDVTRVAKT